MEKKHEALCSALKHEIAEGKYGDGGALPSEIAIVRRFGVSRVTVQRALRDLEREGLISKIPRKGAFVIPERASGRTIEIAFPATVGDEDAVSILRAAERAAVRRGFSVQRVKYARR